MTEIRPNSPVAKLNIMLLDELLYLYFYMPYSHIHMGRLDFIPGMPDGVTMCISFLNSLFLKVS